jgi:D-lactate dehydrogenase (cytochrome)
VAAGGTLSAEHGVGKKTVEVGGQRVPYLELMVGQAGLEQIARAKRALDPGLVLNMGNMVSRSYLEAAGGSSGS